MTITLDLPESAVARLRSAAASQASDLDDYTLSSLLEIADRDVQSALNDFAWWNSLDADAQGS